MIGSLVCFGFLCLGVVGKMASKGTVSSEMDTTCHICLEQ